MPAFLKEIKEYKYPEKKIIGEKSSYKPVDKNNHGVNAWEFLMMELPRNMKPFTDQPAPQYDMARPRREQALRAAMFPTTNRFEDEDEPRSEGFGSMYNGL